MIINRICLSTLMLLVIIVALIMSLVIQQRRANDREKKLRARLDLHESAMELDWLGRYEEAKVIQARIRRMGR